MEVQIYSYKGEDTGKKATLEDGIYAIEPSDHAIYLDVKQYLANKRQGTHKAKERGEIEGSRKKIKRQKGTGTARAGDIKNPIYRGGGRVFGPRVRDYSFKLNKKIKKLARRSALTYKAKEGKIRVIEQFSFDEPKTKYYREMLNNLEASNAKSLLILPEKDSNVYLAGRNIQNANIKVADDVNTYDIVNAQDILIIENAVSTLEEILGNGKLKTA